MINNNIRIKRFTAYCIDLLVVLFIAFGLGQIKALNPHSDDLKEVQERLTEITEEVGNMTPEEVAKTEYPDLIYKTSYYSLSYSISMAVVIILYFTLFPYFNKGMTLGKRLMKIQVVNIDEKNRKAKLWQHFIKALMCPIFSSTILFNALSYILVIILTLILKGMSFVNAYMYLTFIICILCYVDIVMDVATEKGRGLSDKLARVEVIDYVRD